MATTNTKSNKRLSWWHQVNYPSKSAALLALSPFWIPNSIRRNREAVLDFVSQTAEALLTADFELRDDREFAFAVIARNPLAFRYVTPRLQGDREVALFAIERAGAVALSCASLELQNDTLFALDLIDKRGGFFLEHLSPALQDDYEVVLAAVTKAGSALQFASDRLKGYSDISQAAMLEDINAIQYASEEMRADRELAMAAVSLNGSYLQRIAFKFRDDRDVVMAAVSNCSYALKFASDTLKGDHEVVLKAIGADRYDFTANESIESVLQYATPSVKNDRAVVLAAVSKRCEAMKFASDRLKGDRDVVLAALSNSKKDDYGGPKMLHYVSDELKNDRDLVLAATMREVLCFRDASEQLRNDPELVGLVLCEYFRKRKEIPMMWATRPVFTDIKGMIGPVLQTRISKAAYFMQVRIKKLKNPTLATDYPGFAKYHKEKILKAANHAKRCMDPFWKNLDWDDIWAIIIEYTALPSKLACADELIALTPIFDSIFSNGFDLAGMIQGLELRDC